MLAAPDGTLYEGVLYVRGRYPVGSGDAFLAGLITALERGDDWGTRSAWRSGRGGQRRAGRRRPDRSLARAALARQADVHLLSPVRVEPFVEDDWVAFREIRLRSLLDSRDAFGSTYGGDLAVRTRVARLGRGAMAGRNRGRAGGSGSDGSRR